MPASKITTNGYAARRAHVCRGTALLPDEAQAAIGDAFGVTPYFTVFAFLLRLLQSTFIRGQTIAKLSAMPINNVIIDPAQRLLGLPWWCGWSTFAVVCSAEGPLNVGVLSFIIAV